MGLSINGHSTASVSNTVATAIMNSVDVAGLSLVRRDCHEIHPQAPTTDKMARIVTHKCILTNHANRVPVLASRAAGRANGKTQQTPQATAPVESVTAAMPAAFVPGAAFGGIVTADAVEAHAHDDSAEAFARN